MADRALMPIVEYWKSRAGGTRAQAYTAADTQVIPTVRVGRLLFVPVEKADRALGITGTEAAPAAHLRQVA